MDSQFKKDPQSYYRPLLDWNFSVMFVVNQDFIYQTINIAYFHLIVIGKWLQWINLYTNIPIHILLYKLVHKHEADFTEFFCQNAYYELAFFPKTT